jgi:hypothetical protein
MPLWFEMYTERLVCDCRPESMRYPVDAFVFVGFISFNVGLQ